MDNLAIDDQRVVVVLLERFRLIGAKVVPALGDSVSVARSRVAIGVQVFSKVESFVAGGLDTDGKGLIVAVPAPVIVAAAAVEVVCEDTGRDNLTLL